MAPPARASLALLAALAPLAAAGADAPSPPGYGEEVEVVGARPHAVAAGDPSAAATVIEAERFAGEAKTVAELVGTAPGVAVNQYGGLGQLATVSIRGSTADQVQVFLDGLPLNTAAGGGVDLSRIPRAWIERIEVVRGAEGALYGSGALGGVVNIVTRPAVAGTWSAETTAGSFGTWGASADGATGGARWGLLGAAAVDDTSGRFPYLFDPRPGIPGSALEPRERDHNASITAGGLAKAWAAIGEGQLDAVLQVSGGSRDLPGSPYHLTPEDGQHDARIGLVTRFTHPLADGLDLALTVTGRDDRLTVQIAPFPEVAQRDQYAGGTAELRWVAGPNTLALRADLGSERLLAEGSPDHGRGTIALMISDDLALAGGRLHFSPALRWEEDEPYQGLSAKLGSTFRAAGPLTIRANVARTFRVPSFAELYLSQGLLSPNPDLVPETSWSADAGLVLDGKLGYAAVSAFTQLYRDLIVYEPDSFRRMKPFNDGKASAGGIEIEVASAPVGPARLAASAAYTWLATETLRGDDSILGKELPHRPPHRLFARLSAEPGPVAAHVEAQYIASQYQDLSNSPALLVPPALVFNVGTSLRLWRRPLTRLGIEIRNVLDDRSLQDGFGNPLPGRMVMVTLRVAGGKDAT